MYRLPDLSITDKTDTFRMEGQTFSSFRLVARAVQLDMRGQMVVMQNVAPAISSKFVVGHWLRVARQWQQDMPWRVA